MKLDTQIADAVDATIRQAIKSHYPLQSTELEAEIVLAGADAIYREVIKNLARRQGMEVSR